MGTFFRFYGELRDAMSHNTRIVHLTLDNCRVTCKEVQYISEMMRRNGALRVLSLQKNHIRSVGGAYVAKFLDTSDLTNRCRLQRLYLGENLIGPVSI